MVGSEVQKAIYAALVAADVAGDRIYDQPPEDAVFPYVTIGDEQVLDDGTSCGDAWEVFTDVHGWSQPATGSKAEVKDLRAAIVAAVKGISAVSGFSLISVSVDTSRTRRDPDGLTEHDITTFRFLLNGL